MRVLIACEFSGVVRDAFLARGHDAWSCDLLPCERERESKNHIQGDVLEVLDQRWDLMIAHPPCTHLCVSGARWFESKKEEQQQALDFFLTLMNAPIHSICVENPVGIVSKRIKEPDQIIQPWMFGHPEVKRTCLWLKNLLPLKATKVVRGRIPRVHLEAPGEDRWKRRSRTYEGIAQAMAEQWSRKITTHYLPTRYRIKQ